MLMCISPGSMLLAEKNSLIKIWQGGIGGLLSGFGAKRLMWATDFPWILEEPGYGKLTTVIEELLPDLSESELVDIMGGNAKRIFKVP